MDVKITAKNKFSGKEISFTWNEQTGEVSGSDAAIVKNIFKLADGTRWAGVSPDWGVPCDMPNESLEGVACALLPFFDIPDWLAEHLPALPESESIDVDVVY